jgi:hypothetical protein
MSKQKFTNPKDYLNQIVKVAIDKLLNSRHNKFDMIYEVNCGVKVISKRRSNASNHKIMREIDHKTEFCNELLI